MSGPAFLTPLRVEQVSEAAGTWRLLEPLCYVSPIFGGLIVVPAGFVTDFASVPRLPFSYWLFGGVGQAAAVVHDYLYQCHDLEVPDEPRKIARMGQNAQSRPDKEEGEI